MEYYIYIGIYKFRVIMYVRDELRNSSYSHLKNGRVKFSIPARD